MISWQSRRFRSSNPSTLTFSVSMTCSPPLGGEHEIIIRQNCSKVFFTATTRRSTALVLSPENSKIRPSGSAAGSIDRRQETRSIGFSLISASSLTTCSVTSSNRPLFAACSTLPSESIRPISSPSRGTMTLRGTTIQRLKSTTTGSASRSFPQGQRFRLQRSLRRRNKPRRRRQCASRVTSSRPSIRFGCLGQWL
ncbi:IS4/IS5 family transposase (plasmid) [Natrarchaeobaculum sulfurireducens]|uniref:IS4/IS5 family transposase n=1 Tax=Natrarchaeobaculum sulfurireducens TaxID=2044521 RepID=A0A346P9G4_9EURY|nr:IS4/IS5 family transposase [Natrarchaeobaculum sulfurireducens]